MSIYQFFLFLQNLLNDFLMVVAELVSVVCVLSFKLLIGWNGISKLSELLLLPLLHRRLIVNWLLVLLLWSILLDLLGSIFSLLILRFQGSTLARSLVRHGSLILLVLLLLRLFELVSIVNLLLLLLLILVLSRLLILLVRLGLDGILSLNRNLLLRLLLHLLLLLLLLFCIVVERELRFVLLL